MKKVLSAVIALLIITTMCCTLVGCNSQPTEGLQYTLNDDGESYALSGIGTATDTSIVIASSYQSLPVISIEASSFVGNVDIVSVHIPSTVEVIGMSAFSGCTALSKVTFGNDSQLQEIKSMSFCDCELLENIDLPDGVVSLGTASFCRCTSLTKITIPDSVIDIYNYAFNECTSLKSVKFGSNSQLEGMWDFAFSSCTSLESIDIVTTVSSMGELVFYGNTVMEEIVVAEDNECYSSIEGNLYSADGSVLIQYAVGSTANEFVVPDSVITVSAFAFATSQNLTKVTIGNNVEYIGGSIFYDCEEMQAVEFPANTNWYSTTQKDNWLDKTAGTSLSTISPETNAAYFTDDMTNYRMWYRAD